MSAFVQPAKNQEEREDSNKSQGLKGMAIKEDRDRISLYSTAPIATISS